MDALGIGVARVALGCSSAALAAVRVLEPTVASGCRAQGLGLVFGISGLGYRVFRVHSLGFRLPGELRGVARS